MSTKKQGLFGRLRTAISSTLNDAVDAVSDPGQEIALMLDDLAAQIKQAELDHRQAVVDKKMMERKIAELEKDEKAWQKRAEQALSHGDEQLARAALERKSELSEEKKTQEEGLIDQIKLVEDMAEHIKRSKKRLKSLNLKRGTLMAQARAAKRGDVPGGDFGDGAVSKIDEIEAKIASLEAMNEVAAELDGGRIKEANLEAQFAKMGTASDVDDELAALKAKMAGKKALSAGDEDG